MRIVIIGTAYPYRGGLAAFNERLAKEFAASGDEVDIETFTLQYPSLLFPGKTQYSEGEPPEGLSIRRSVNSINPFNWISVGRRLAKARYDLAIFRYWLPYMAPCLGTIARQIRKNGHTRVVALIDNVIPHEKRFMDSQFSKYFIGGIEGFVYMSHSVGRDLRLFDKQKPAVYAPHPVYDIFGEAVPRDEALRYLKLDGNYRYFLFFGFIRDYKGLDLLMEALADPRLKDNPKLRLIVAGEFYGNEQKYKQLESDLGLADRIVWTNDFIPDDKVRYYFSAADLIVQPYRSATQSGVSQIAYHFVKPMVVTDVGGLSEFIPDGKVGYVVKPEPPAIASAIADFYSLSDYGRFDEGIKEEKRRYSWNYMVSAIKGVL